MARDHRKLRVFHEAHQLTVGIYLHTRNFPRDEWFGTRAQMRRAAVSVPCNIVEGSARRTTREYLHFLNIARASAGELGYLIELAGELGFVVREAVAPLKQQSQRLLPQMERLVQQVEFELRREEAAARPRAKTRKPRAQSPEPKADQPTP